METIFLIGVVDRLTIFNVALGVYEVLHVLKCIDKQNFFVLTIKNVGDIVCCDL